MCKWNTLTHMELTIPAHLSHTGRARKEMVGVDSCIAPIVKALNDAGVTTDASCCGHGKRPGIISLGDGRAVQILPDYATWEKVNEFLNTIGFAPINPEGT